MKKIKPILSLIVALMVSSVAFADEVKVESYAHPTMFGTEAQQTIADDQSVYVVGNKDLKDENQININGKDAVVIDSFVKDMLALLKANSNQKMFNPKMPILRSELAVDLAEGLSIKTVKPKYKYLDISSDYWAKAWIDKVLSEGVMSGYPDKKFRPDQPITKAEVFATSAQLMNVPIDRSKLVPNFKGYKMQYIPEWAIAPTKEVLASKLLDEVPDAEKAAKSKYLSKEQVAYLVGALRQNYIFDNKFANSKYKPTYVTVSLDERVDARHSNIGDTFYTTTTQETTVKDTVFPVGSKVLGEVVGVSRPGIKNPGYVKVKFTSIRNDKTAVCFPRNISEVRATETKTTNPVARIFAAPFSASGRVLGVAGRTVGTGVNGFSNDVERYGDNISNVFANTLSLEPKAGLRSAGKSFVTIGNCIVNTAKLVVSGTFGVVYEFGDEVRYLFVPKSINNSALNAGEELVIIY